LQASNQGESPSPAGQPPPQPSPAEQASQGFKDRLEKALQKTGVQKSLDEIKGADVEEDDTAEEKPATPPKAPATDTAPGATSESTEDGGAEEKGEKASREPKYDDARKFGAWVTRNPEKAAELAAKVFKIPLGGDAEGWKKHFISAENKRRRMNEGLERERAAIDADKEAVSKMAKEALGSVQPILDVIEAESKGDFPAIDAFIESTFGISFNDYCAKRLRGGSKETAAERAAKLKAEKLEKELAELKAGKGEEPKAKAEKGAPKVSEKWVNSEVPEEHGVRDLRDWQTQVEAVYQDSYDDDTEEYGLSIEDAADRVLKAFLKKRGLSSEESAKPPKAKPKKKRPPVDEEEDEERTPARDLDDDKAPDDLTERVRWALRRAEKRR
jgi:hypothetical protein